MIRSSLKMLAEGKRALTSVGACQSAFSTSHRHAFNCALTSACLLANFSSLFRPTTRMFKFSPSHVIVLTWEHYIRSLHGNIISYLDPTCNHYFKVATKLRLVRHQRTGCTGLQQ